MPQSTNIFQGTTKVYTCALNHKINFERDDILKILNCVTSLFFQLGVFAGGMSSFIDDGSSKDNKVISES